MSIVVPPAPSHENVPTVMERLNRLSQDASSGEQDGRPMRQSRRLLIASCLLCTCGMFLLICALAVMCAPDAPLSRGVFLVCETLF